MCNYYRSVRRVWEWCVVGGGGGGSGLGLFIRQFKLGKMIRKYLAYPFYQEKKAGIILRVRAHFTSAEISPRFLV